MTKNSLIDPISEYLHKIEQFFPYSTNKKTEAIMNLRKDIEEALKDSKKDDPEEVFGHPQEVARNYSINYEWGVEKVGFRRRTLAYCVDLIASFTIFSLCFLGHTLATYFAIIGFHEVSVILFNLAWIILAGAFCHQMITERYFSTTIGKRLLGLIVSDHSGIRITWSQAIIRNLSKAIPGLILPELIIGKYIETDKFQRPLDKAAETIVVKNEQKIVFWKLGLTIILLCLVSIFSYPLAYFIISGQP
ncbi:MAG: RDD family protein [Promethearchaeota archaeon]